MLETKIHEDLCAGGFDWRGVGEFCGSSQRDRVDAYYLFTDRKLGPSGSSDEIANGKGLNSTTKTAGYEQPGLPLHYNSAL